MNYYGAFARGMAKPQQLYSGLHGAQCQPRRACASLASWSAVQHNPPAPFFGSGLVDHSVRLRWRSPEKLYEQATRLRPLILCFAGLRTNAAPASTEADALLSNDGGSSSSSSNADGSGSSYPTTVEELAEVVAANTPVFYLHPRERFFPCTVEWFLQHARLAVMKNFMLRRRVDKVVVPYGKLDAQSLREAYEADPKQRLQIQLRRNARPGQPEVLNDIPVYAHIRETVDLHGQRDAIEIVYMKFFAFNGPYWPFGIIPTRTLGAHDSDWEHVTVRLTPDGQQVTGVYYSCHRHIDGTWCSADEVPRTAEGRPQSFVAINGHGSYPYPGTIIRLFGAFNDQTSRDGKLWAPHTCVLVTPEGRLPSVESRGEELNGTAYPSLGGGSGSNGGSSGSASGSSSSGGSSAAGDSAGVSGGSDSSGSSNSGSAAANSAGALSPVGSALAEERGVTLRHDPEPDWLKYGGKWGSTVQAPALQEWFVGSENPVSRTWLQTVFFPLVPGVPTLLEPVEEQVEDASDYINQQVADAQQSVEEARAQAQQSLEQYQKALMERYEQLMASTTKGVDKDNKEGNADEGEGGGSPPNDRAPEDDDKRC
jgi:hypothetical protein